MKQKQIKDIFEELIIPEYAEVKIQGGTLYLNFGDSSNRLSFARFVQSLDDKAISNVSCVAHDDDAETIDFSFSYKKQGLVDLYITITLAPSFLPYAILGMFNGVNIITKEKELSENEDD